MIDMLEDDKPIKSQIMQAIKTDLTGESFTELIRNLTDNSDLSRIDKSQVNGIARIIEMYLSPNAPVIAEFSSDITVEDLTEHVVNQIVILLAQTMPQHNDSTKSYLEYLESSLMFGKCAGKTTQIEYLFQNRVFYEQMSEIISLALVSFIEDRKPIELFDRNARLESKVSQKVLEDIESARKIVRKYLNKSKSYRMYANPKTRSENPLGEDFQNHLLSAKVDFILAYNVVMTVATQHIPGANSFVNNFYAVPHQLLENPECDLVDEIMESFDQLSSRPERNVIFGQPGYGKSIFLRQVALQLTERSLRFDPKQDHVPIIPIFTSARNLISEMRQISGGIGELRGPEDFIELKGLLAGASCRGSKYLETKNVLPVLELLQDQREANQANRWQFILLIDAYDECDREERNFITTLIQDDLDDYDVDIIMTSRDHLRNELLEAQVISQDFKSRELWMSFTQQELEMEMPMRLANAWGIEQEALLDNSSTIIKEYREVLINPLFVGYFCMLLENEQLNPTRTMENFSSISIGGIKLIHVDFLQKVMKYGLEITIAERNVVKHLDLDQITKIFYHIALTTLLSKRESTFAKIWKDLEINWGIKTSPEVRRIIRENLGVMYAAGPDENEIIWSHKTFQEIAAAVLIASWGSKNSWSQNGHPLHGSRFLRRHNGHLSHDLLTTAFSIAYMNEINDKNKPDNIERDLLPTMASLFDKIPIDFIGQLEYIEYPLIAFNNTAERKEHQSKKLKILSRPGTSSHAFAQSIINGFSVGIMPYSLPMKTFHVDREILHFLFEEARFARTHDGLCAIRFRRYPLYIRDPPLDWLLTNARSDGLIGDFGLFLLKWRNAVYEWENNDLYSTMAFVDETGEYNPIYTTDDWEEFHSKIINFDVKRMSQRASNKSATIWAKINQWLIKLVALSGPSEGDEGYDKQKDWPDCFKILTQKLVSEPAKKMLSSLGLQETHNTPLDMQEKKQLAQLLYYRFNMDESQCVYEIPYLEARDMNWFLRLVCALRWNSLEEKSERSSSFEKFRTEPIWESEIVAITRVYGQIPRHAFKFPKEELEKMRLENRLIK